MTALQTSFVEVLWIARFDYQPQARLANHKHDFFQMIYFLSGSGSLILGEEEYPITPGTLFLIKPFVLHSLSAASLVKTLDIKFLVKDQSLGQLLLDSSHLLEPPHAGLADLFERIRAEGERGGYLSRELCNVFLWELLLRYLQLQRNDEPFRVWDPVATETPGDTIVHQVVNLIHKRYAEDWTLSELACSLKVSDRHIRKHFKATLGVSPHRYLLQVRIHKARALIQYSSYAFKEIAHQVGFKTVHHFTRAFHDVCSETPGSWRRKSQEGICKDVCIDPQFVNTNWIISTSGSTQSRLG